MTKNQFYDIYKLLGQKIFVQYFRQNFSNNKKKYFNAAWVLSGFIFYTYIQK